VLLSVAYIRRGRRAKCPHRILIFVHLRAMARVGIRIKIHRHDGSSDDESVDYGMGPMIKVVKEAAKAKAKTKAKARAGAEPIAKRRKSGAAADLFPQFQAIQAAKNVCSDTRVIIDMCSNDKVMSLRSALVAAKIKAGVWTREPSLRIWLGAPGML
jgi:hypothetical protein